MKGLLAVGLSGLLVLTVGVVDVATHKDPVHRATAPVPAPTPTPTLSPSTVPSTCAASASPTPSTAPSARPAPAKAATYPKQWDARVQPLISFVQQQRGLTYKHPVAVSFLSNAAFDKQVAVPAPESAQDKKDLATELGTLRALGLVGGAVDIAKALDTLDKSEVIGLYVPEKHAVFVRGTTLDPYTRVTLVHELTHVLQDQYFDLDKMKDDAPGGDSTAVTALIEGDAVRIQNLYAKQLSAEDQKAFDAAQERDAKRATGSAAVPEILSDFLSFPYAFGPALLGTLTAEGGNGAVDNAFRHPPSEEAQVVDPDKHPLGEKPKAVPAPSLPACAVVLDHVAPFGQVSLFEVLGSRLPYDTSWRAVSGWQGDAYRPYELNGRTCLGINVASSTGSVLASGLMQWAARVPGAQVARAGDVVSVHACDPGPTAPVPPKSATTAFDILSARAGLIESVLDDGGSFDLARCTTDGVLAGLGPAHEAELTAPKLSSSQLSQLRELFQKAAQRCRSQGHS